jgi:hypothetical protein
MKKVRISRKRPCRVCRRWFRPNPRVGDSQKTCGDPHCKREWHRRKCVEWNRENRDYFKGMYLKEKLAATGGDKQKPECTTHSRFHAGLPWQEIQEAIGLKQLVIIDYIMHLLLRHFQELIKIQSLVNTG